MLAEEAKIVNMGLEQNTVAVTFTGLKGYPTTVPFHPPEKFPEYTGTQTDPGNLVYLYVRETLYRIGLDRENYNTARWNPFKNIIEPGMMVFVKPNTVRHFHIEGKDIFSVIIHASIMRPILDYICIALRGEGRIVIGDSQVIYGHFDEAMAKAQIDTLVDWYRQQTNIPIELFDLRMYRAVPGPFGSQWGRERVAKDPRGYVTVNLGEESNFRDIDPRTLRINIASHKNMYKHHSNGHHDYVFPKSVLMSDAIISIPKFKTHRRTAITFALKNFMGLPAWKDSLPHFRLGSPAEGGDQYPNPSFRKRIHTRLRDMVEDTQVTASKLALSTIDRAILASGKLKKFPDIVNEGMWYGNDTLWRTLLDIQRCVFYADADGNLRDTPQRRYFCLMDGIVGGEGNGPIQCDPVYPGILMGGFNPIAFDAVASTLFGFDIDKIPTVKRGRSETSRLRVFTGGRESIRVMDGDDTLTLDEFGRRHNLRLAPHPNWVGKLERA